LVAVIGVIWMTLTGENSEQAPNALLGNFLEFLAMASAVGYTLMVKHLVRRYLAFLLTALQSFAGTLFFLPLALASPWPEQVSLSTFGLLIYLGLVITLGAYGLYNYSLTYLKATVAAGYTNLLPVFPLLFSMLLLGERLVVTQWLAIGLVFVGVFLSHDRRQRVPPEAPPAVTD
jgi:drug/metabolite transporter (DMT)-like permease